MAGGENKRAVFAELRSHTERLIKDACSRYSLASSLEKIQVKEKQAEDGSRKRGPPPADGGDIIKAWLQLHRQAEYERCSNTSSSSDASSTPSQTLRWKLIRHCSKLISAELGDDKVMEDQEDEPLRIVEKLGNK